MSDTTIESGGPLPLPGRYNPIFQSDLEPGAPVCVMDAAEAPRTGIVPNSVIAAKANGANTTYAIGIVTKEAAVGARGEIAYQGAVFLPASAWASVIDIGGALQQGHTYWLSDATAGKITATKPSTSGHFAVAIGYALSPNGLFVQPSSPAAL